MLHIIINARSQGEIVLIIRSIGKITAVGVDLVLLFVCLFLVDCKIDAIIYVRTFYFNAFFVPWNK